MILKLKNFKYKIRINKFQQIIYLRMRVLILFNKTIYKMKKITSKSTTVRIAIKQSSLKNKNHFKKY